MDKEVLTDRFVHKDVDFSDKSILMRLPYKRRRCPLMVTIVDPKITSVDFQKMLELRVNAVRFKSSYCTKGEKIRLLGQLDKAVSFLSKKHAVLDWPVTTCLELKTSIVKTGILEGDVESIFLKEGQKCDLIYNLALFDKCNANVIFVDNPYIGVDTKVDMYLNIFQEDAVIELRCVKIIDKLSIKCVVTKSGLLTNMNHLVIRGEENSSKPLVTKKDFQAVKFAIEYQLDMIMINYTRKAETIIKIKEYIGKTFKPPLIIAGVCGAQGIQNIDEIIREADGIVFSREYLSVELNDKDRYRLLNIQKVFSAKCQQAGKPFYISGDVFRRALTRGEFYDDETSDITNAILDGASGFVLKACDDIEKLLEVINAINELCCTVEPLTNSKTDFWRILESIKIPVNAAEAAAISCAAVSHQRKSRMIVIPTVSGCSAKILTWLRPACLIITVSTNTATTRRLQAFRCVVPLKFKGEKYKDWYKAVEARVTFAVEYAVKMEWIKLGDHFVTLQRGSEDSAFCDTVRIWTVEIAQKTMVECPDDTARRPSIKVSSSPMPSEKKSVIRND